MGIDDPPSVIEVDNSDSDIEVIACCIEVPTSRPLGVAGRCMTTELSEDEDEFSLFKGLYGSSIREVSENPQIRRVAITTSGIWGKSGSNLSRKLHSMRPIG